MTTPVPSPAPREGRRGRVLESSLPSSGPGRTPRHRGRLRSTTLVVILVGLAVTGGLAAAARVNYDRNERHLTRLQAELTASALSSAPVDVERRLGKAVGLAAATEQPAEFRRSIAASVGRGGPFADAELYRVSGGRLHLEGALGVRSLLAASSGRLERLAVEAQRSSSLAVTRIVVDRAERFGYAMSAKGPDGTYVAYAEQALAPGHRVAVGAANPTSSLNAAVYDGRPSPATLVLTDASHLPLRGITARVPVPFGDTTLTLVVGARQPLAGALSRSLPWLIVVLGVVLSGVGGALVERLLRRRTAAETLAAQVDELYRAQRSVAETLQDSLLPRRLVTPAGLEVGVRYRAGTAGIDIGGDWYDLLRLDCHRAFFSVGDVAGRGLHAAVLMSTLRNGINAYARDGNQPEAVLAKLDTLIDVGTDGRFATVVCGLLDASTGALQLCLAGHPPPVLITSDGSEPVHAPVGPPVGIGGDRPTTHVVVPPGATLLAYTDGLVERRREPVTAGIARLCAATTSGGELDALLDRVLDALVPDGPSDDIAMLALRRSP